MSTEQIVGRLSEMRTSPGAVRWSAMETLGGLTGGQQSASGGGTLGGAVGGVLSGKRSGVMAGAKGGGVSGVTSGVMANAMADRQREFGRLLGRQLSIGAPESGSTPIGPASGTEGALPAGPSVREAAEDLVSIALVQPVLKQIRDGNHLPPPFGPGPAEKQFGTLVDAQWTRSMVKSKNFPLVGAVERYISRANGAVAPVPATASANASGAGPTKADATGESTADTAPAGVIAPAKL